MTKQIIFKYQPPIVSNLEIYLVGDFNNWEKTGYQLVDEGGVYEISLSLEPGEYKYHFIINGKISLDPSADTVEVDGIIYSTIKVASNEEYIYLIPFRLKDKANLQEVSVVGDFNSWKPNYNSLYKEGKNFSTLLFLTNSTYNYKYLAKDDRWFNEQEMKSGINKTASDNSSKNSLISTSAKQYKKINRELVASFDSNQLDLKQQIINIYRYSDKVFEFKVILPDFSELQAHIVINKKLYNLDFIASDGRNCAFSKIIEFHNISGVWHFQAIITFAKFKIYANERTLTNNPEINSVIVPSDFQVFSISPDLSKSIMYQIMPDRFRKGDSTLNPDFHEKYYDNSRKKPPKKGLEKNQEYYHLSSWGDIDILTKNPYSAKDEPDWFAFYGGDMKGVNEKIPYLKELGITLIYFNPIFTAKSPHRYDTIDFMKVDPHLGTNESFITLVEELHKNGMKVIIDIALNHCGVDFFAFKDSSLNGDKSDYYKWFDWHKWPLPDKIDKEFNAEEYYQCWWGVKDLPEFNYDLSRETPQENKIRDIQQAMPNVELVNYLLDSMRYWVETVNIDGFRLDVPEEVPFWFWKLFRSMVKQINPDIYLVGEVWNNPKNWLQGDYFDGIMNYNSFKDPCIDYFFLDKISLLTFKNAISQGLIFNADQVIKSQMNLLASHDTIRIRKLANENLDKQKLVLLFQFTFIGIPHIYYGDEVFLDGYKDPDNRRPFPWDYKEDESSVKLLEFNKMLIRIRKDNSLLTEGHLRFREHQHLLIYERWLESENQRIIVILNNNDTEVDITNFISEFPEQLLISVSSNKIVGHGYYIATT